MINVIREIINGIMKKLLTGNALEKQTRELGVDIQRNPIAQSVNGRNKRAAEFEC